MSISYYSVVPTAYASLIDIPGNVPVYPGIPTNPVSPVPLKVTDLILHARLNAFTSYVAQIPLDWIDQMFQSITAVLPTGEICVAPYDRIDIDWKNVFSKTLGVSVSLAIATKSEGFTFFVPVRCCVGQDDELYMGRHKWPLYIAHSVPHKWRLSKLWIPAYEDTLMPDLLLMDWDANDAPRFSVMEAKGREKPIDSKSYSEYPKWKHQAENARLVPFPLGPVGKTHILPILHRKILSVVAVRPNAKKEKTRKIQCRWFNHRTDENVSVPADWAVEMIAMHYGYYLQALGFRRLGFAVSYAYEFGLPITISDATTVRAQELPGIRMAPGTDGDSLVPFITERTYQLVLALIAHLVNGDRESGAENIVALAKAHTTLDHVDALSPLDSGNVSVLPSGMGIARPRERFKERV